MTAGMAYGSVVVVVAGAVGTVAEAWADGLGSDDEQATSVESRTAPATAVPTPRLRTVHIHIM